jgi:hypothetical protein
VLVASLLNPSLVVVGGLLTLADEPLLAGAREVVYRRSLPLATRNLQITVSQLGALAATTGLTLMLAAERSRLARIGWSLWHWIPGTATRTLGPQSAEMASWQSERRSRRMTAAIGDRIVVESEKVGRPARQGEILEVIVASYGTRYRVRWDDGHESTFSPAAGSASIVPREKPTKG